MNNADYRQISELAYAIWEKEGRPQGRDLDHWLAAERELQVSASPVDFPVMELVTAKLAEIEDVATGKSKRTGSRQR
jgi:hypothetical protein